MEKDAKQSPKDDDEVQKMTTIALSCCKKNPSALLGGITSKHYSDIFCFNCLHSFRTKTKLESHKRVCENKGFCDILKY